jgi:hypothetical protein
MTSRPGIYENLQQKVTELEKTSSKISLSEIFVERRCFYINEFALFLAHFNVIPNFIHEINIDCKRANVWFQERYRPQIWDWHFDKRYLEKSNKQAEYDDIFYLLYDDLLVDFDTRQSVVRFLFRDTAIEKIDALIGEIKRFKGRNSGCPEISLLIDTSAGIELKSLKITKPRLNIEDNYNDDFREIHQTILKRLSKKNDKGLVILHGKPGTGKTFYIFTTQYGWCHH